MTAGRWAFVCVAGGAPVLGLVDACRWRGWLVPWFTDASMERIATAYFEDDPERGTWQAQSGEWICFDDDGEQVRLDRHRKTVVVNGRRGTIALTDSDQMSWCWEEAPESRAELAAALEQVVLEMREAPARSRRPARKPKRR